MVCPSWCAEEHLEAGPFGNLRAEGYHRSVDIPMTYIVGNGEPAQRYIALDASRQAAGGGRDDRQRTRRG